MDWSQPLGVVAVPKGQSEQLVMRLLGIAHTRSYAVLLGSAAMLKSPCNNAQAMSCQQPTSGKCHRSSGSTPTNLSEPLDLPGKGGEAQLHATVY